MSEGYVLVATNDQHYVEMAVSAACSLRANDDRPVALLIAGGVSVPRRYLDLFEYVVAYDPEPPFDGDFLRRFVLECYTPFDRAMHIDADCLLIRSDIDRFWAKFSGLPVGVMARFVTTGTLYRKIDVDAIISTGVAPGVYASNWGIFYYENTGENPVMRRCRELLRQHLNGDAPTHLTYRSRPGQLSDEPFWGIAMAQQGVDVPEIDRHDALQITSPATSDHDFDYAGRTFSARKGNVRGVTGQFYHFAALRPLDGYLEGVAYFRRLAGLEPPAIRTGSGRIVPGSEWADAIADLISEIQEGTGADFQFVTT